jgi:CHAT domain-containing protein/tetratricopeptide (TPR) repeat protein
MIYRILFLLLLCTTSLQAQSSLESINAAREIAMQDGDYEKALELLKTAVQLEQTDSSLARQKEFLGDAYYGLGMLDSALYFYQRYRKAATQFFGKEAEATGLALRYEAQVLTELSAFEEALSAFEQAMKILEKTSGQQSMAFAETMMSMAILQTDLGEFDEALLLLKRAKPIYEKFSDRKGTVYTDFLGQFAILYQELGQFDLAEQYYLQVLELDLANLGEKHPNIAISYNNLAALYSYILDHIWEEEERKIYINKAKSYYEKALALDAENFGKDHPYYAIDLSNYAGLLADLGQEEEAIAKQEEALKIKATFYGKENVSYAYSLNSLAIGYQKLEKYEKAEASFLEMLEIFENTYGKEHPRYAKVCDNIADLYLKKGDIQKTNDFVLKTLNANSPDLDAASIAEIQELDLKKIEFYNVKTTASSIMSLIQLNDKLFDEGKQSMELAYKWTRKGLDFVSFFRQSFIEEGDKRQLSNWNHSFARMAVYFAFQLYEETDDVQYLKDALSYVESSNNSSLLDALQSEKAAVFGKLPAEIQKKESNLIEQKKGLQKKLLTVEGDKTSIRAEITRLGEEIDVFKKQLEQDYPEYYRIKYQESNLNIPSLQNSLQTDQLLIQYFFTKKKVYVFCILKDAFETYAFDLDLEDFRERIKLFRASLTDYYFIRNEEKKAREIYQEQAYWFYQKMLEPVLEKYPQTKNLIIIPDVELGQLPFEAFLTQKTEGKDYQSYPYLLKDYSISYNYASTLLQENISRPKLKGKARLMGVAASYNQKKQGEERGNRSARLRNLRDALNDLPAAKKEVEGLEALFKGAFYYEMAANEHNFKQYAKDYDILHLAMHGLLNSKQPILSTLAFTEDGDSLEDNFLHAYEISQMDLNAQLVVLSACETGYGQLRTGEGVMSLARSFMYAGIPSLLVSLWQVNDASTAIIMQKFYEELAKGESKAAALRKAKLQYLTLAGEKNPIAAHPAFWAAFIQLGDADAIHLSMKSDTNALVFWGLIVLVGLLVLGLGYWLLKKNRQDKS